MNPQPDDALAPLSADELARIKRASVRLAEILRNGWRFDDPIRFDVDVIHDLHLLVQSSPVLLAQAEREAGLRAVLEKILDNAEGLGKGADPSMPEGARWYFQVITELCRSALRKVAP